MKKYLFVLLMFCGLSASAQAYPDFYHHEFKLNFGLFLITTGVEFSYEYYIDEDISVGGSIRFDDDAQDFNGNFGIGPNVRAYFGHQPQNGFFAEAFGTYFSGEEDREVEVGDPPLDNYTTFALGVGGGYKIATRSQRFTAEINGGFARNISPESYQDSFTYKAGISLGFRF